MSWHPNDLVSDQDLEAYEQNILTRFGPSAWVSRRTKALEDWLWPILANRGFNPERFRTRFEPNTVWGFTSPTYTDLTTACQSADTEDVNLAGVFAVFGTDALYIGSDRQFRGLFFRLHDAVSSATGVMSVAYWNGNWEPLTITDGTVQVAGKTLSAGGSVTWSLPVDWAVRAVNASDRRYYVKVTLSATPTGAVASQIGCIRASVLRAPTTFRTLQLIMQEAPTGAQGPWEQKALFYAAEADAALQRAIPLAGGEFDTDESDLVSEEESQQTQGSVGNTFTWERA
jgi:hypothetical protein